MYVPLLSDVKSFSLKVNFANLPNDVVDDLVDGEANVGVDGEHLSQCIFILSRIQVAIQQAAYHIQECWVVLFQLHLTCGNKEKWT